LIYPRTLIVTNWKRKKKPKLNKYTIKASLLEAIGSFILQKGLSANKLYHFGSDRTLNMIGIRNGLATLLKNET